jgi:Zn-dependent peptidase ImmA (M78 family)
MTSPTTPGAWANLLSRLWGRDRFPIDVEVIARDISSRQPDPIIKIAGAELDDFEGGLFKRKKGWFLVYNDQVQSKGRINFTMAHELGHYLLHREQGDSFQCGTEDLLDWGSTVRQMEVEADKFAAMLLMPLDDYRSQIGSAPVNLDMLGECAERYAVSLLAAMRQWLEFTPKRAVMVVSREGFIKWSWSSKSAMRTQNYFRFGKETIPIPEDSIAACTARYNPSDERRGIEIPAKVWFPHEPSGMTAREMRIVSDQYDLVISLIVLPDRDPWERELEEDELLTDTYTNFIRNGQNPY